VKSLKRHHIPPRISSTRYFRNRPISQEAILQKLLAGTAAAPALAEDMFFYWIFKDLQARRIVATRTDLYRKQRLT
jgi:hypothetical protein